MAISIDSTAGGASANSYVSAGQADDYFASSTRGTTWASKTADQRAAALIDACRRIEMERFLGTRASAGQSLAWPRFGVVVDGIEIDGSTVPAPVSHAQMELALVYLGAPPAETGLEGFEDVAVGPVKVKPRSRRADTLPALVARLLAPVLAVGQGVFTIVRA